MADWLCTLKQATDEIKAQGATALSPDDVKYVTNQIVPYSRRLNNLTRLRFVPYLQVHYYDAFGDFIDDVQRKIDLGRAILAPANVLDAFNNQLVLNTDYVTVPQDTPPLQLQLISALVYGWSYGFGFGTYFWIAPGQFLRKIQVAGAWAFRDQYDNGDGWVDSLQSIQDGGGINATQTTLTVTNAGDLDANGYSPCLDVGNFIMLGPAPSPTTIHTNVTAQPNGNGNAFNLNITSTDFEWMQVIAVNTTTNVLTVKRGANGSTRQIWPEGTEIFTWSVQPEINRAAYRAVAYVYSRRGFFEQVKSDLSNAGAKTYIYPADLPEEVVAILQQTRDWQWKAV